jgi:hypothetical protein
MRPPLLKAFVDVGEVAGLFESNDNDPKIDACELADVAVDAVVAIGGEFNRVDEVVVVVVVLLFANAFPNDDPPKTEVESVLNAEAPPKILPVDVDVGEVTATVDLATSGEQIFKPCNTASVDEIALTGLMLPLFTGASFFDETATDGDEVCVTFDGGDEVGELVGVNGKFDANENLIYKKINKYKISKMN